MGKVVELRPDHEAIQEQASLWLARLDARELSPQETEAFKHWLAERVEHREAIMEMAALWDDLDILSCLADLIPLDQVRQFGDKRHGLFRWSGLGFATAAIPVMAAVAVLLLGPALFETPGQNADRLFSSISQTSIGEQQTLTLPEGSQAILNTDSRMEVSFGPAQRNVRLLKGEALFHVAHDPDRPFVVHAGSGVVRAVGTAFSVQLKGEQVEVIVTEGKVAVTPAVLADKAFVNSAALAAHSPVATVGAGQQASYGEESIFSVKSIAAADLEQRLSWRQGMLLFNGESLDEVVRELSRYTETEIVITDPKIRNTSVGGYFRVGETEALFSALKENFGIDVDVVTERLVYLKGSEGKEE